MVYAGLDLHKKTIQIAAVDDSGTGIMNKKIQNTREALAGETSKIPSNSKYVIESSSVWEAVYRHMRNDLGLDVVLSDPYKTRLIAESKKTDKADGSEGKPRMDMFPARPESGSGRPSGCHLPTGISLSNVY